MEAESKSDLHSVLRAVFGFAVLGAIVFGLYCLYDNRMWYATWYGTGNISEEDVHINKKPHDCDFDSDPLGSKNCHYKKNIIVFKVMRKAQGSERFISWDGGITWDACSPEAYVKARDFIEVAWSKVED